MTVTRFEWKIQTSETAQAGQVPAVFDYQPTLAARGLRGIISSPADSDSNRSGITLPGSESPTKKVLAQQWEPESQEGFDSIQVWLAESMA